MSKLVIFLLAFAAAFIGGIKWIVWDIPLYLTGIDVDDEDDFKNHFGWTSPAMKPEYARIQQYFGGPEVDPTKDFNRSKLAGGLYHHLKGVYCTWAGLSRERAGKFQAAFGGLIALEYIQRIVEALL